MRSASSSLSDQAHGRVFINATRMQCRATGTGRRGRITTRHVMCHSNVVCIADAASGISTFPSRRSAPRVSVRRRRLFAIIVIRRDEHPTVCGFLFWTFSFHRCRVLRVSSSHATAFNDTGTPALVVVTVILSRYTGIPNPRE